LFYIVSTINTHVYINSKKPTIYYTTEKSNADLEKFTV